MTNKQSSGIKFAVLAMVIAFLVPAAPAQAQLNTPLATPCSETISKYCKDVIPGNGRIVKCLSEHKDDLSIACKDWIEEQTRNLNDLMGLCTTEISTLCKYAPPDKVSMYFCLQDNYINLRMDCRSKLGEIRDRLK